MFYKSPFVSDKKISHETYYYIILTIVSNPVVATERGVGGHARRQPEGPLPAGDRAAPRAVREGTPRHGELTPAHRQGDGGETPRRERTTQVLNKSVCI